MHIFPNFLYGNSRDSVLTCVNFRQNYKLLCIAVRIVHQCMFLELCQKSLLITVWFICLGINNSCNCCWSTEPNYFKAYPIRRIITKLFGRTWLWRRYIGKIYGKGINGGLYMFYWTKLKKKVVHIKSFL